MSALRLRTAAIRPQALQPGTVLRRTVLGVLLLCCILMFLGPLYWLVTSALKPNSEIYSYPPKWIPSSLAWQNFAEAWASVPFARFIVNSIICTTCGTALTLINASFSSYALTFLKFPFREVVFYVMLGALMIPGDVHLVPNYITVSNLGLLNTYPGIFIPTGASVFGTFLMRQHMRTIPREVFEAAKMDRAGHIRILFGVILPMSRPILVTTLVITMIGEWNSFIWPLIVTSSNTMRTLPIGLLFLKSEFGVQNWGAIMAGTIMTALPMIIAFIVAQRHIVAGLTSSAHTTKL